MNLVVIDIDQLKGIINEAVLEAVRQINKPADPDQLMRRVDVAKELQVSLKTIAAWMKSGRLPYHRINSRIFFKRSEILEAMQRPTRK